MLWIKTVALIVQRLILFGCIESFPELATQAHNGGAVGGVRYRTCIAWHAKVPGSCGAICQPKDNLRCALFGRAIRLTVRHVKVTRQMPVALLAKQRIRKR